MTGDDSGSDPTYDQPRVPAALRDRITGLFVEHRGYEPASFQESLSLVTDLAAAQIDGDIEALEDSVSAESEDRTSETETSADPTDESGGAAEPIDEVTVEVTDDVTDDTFETLDQQSIESTETAAADTRSSATDSPESGSIDGGSSDSGPVVAGDGADSSGSSGGEEDADAPSATVSALDDGGLDGPSDDAGTLHANPESSCALCGDVHRVSALQTTILDGTGSVALICPDCVE